MMVYKSRLKIASMPLKMTIMISFFVYFYFIHVIGSIIYNVIQEFIAKKVPWRSLVEP